jgi:hypothetical protein
MKLPVNFVIGVDEFQTSVKQTVGDSIFTAKDIVLSVVAYLLAESCFACVGGIGS